MEKLDLIVKLIEKGNDANEKEHKSIEDTNSIGVKAINDRLDILNSGQKKNTNFRVETQTVIKLFKYGIPIVGGTGVLNAIHIYIEYFL